MNVEQRVALLAASCLSMSVLCLADHASADELLPDMIWKEGEMSPSEQADGGQITTCDYLNSYGYGTCRENESGTLSICSYKTTDPDAQVAAQFQCCDQSYSDCGEWAWFDTYWTSPGGETQDSYVCDAGSLHYARISCVVAVPNPN